LNPNFNITYLLNGKEHLNSAKTGESGVKKLDMPELLQIFKSHSGMEKRGALMDLVRLSVDCLLRNIYLALKKALVFVEVCSLGFN
jgi:hypothetical protein